MITCHILGPIHVEVEGRSAPPELLWRKHLALLVYLARSPRRTRSRDHLAALLWSEKPDSAARHSLNEALRVIRRAAGDAAVETQGDRVTLGAGAVTLDVDAFEAAAASGDLAAAADLVVGEFLEGFSIASSPGFEDWVAAERLHWTARTAAVLASRAQQLVERGRLDEAVRVAERGVTLDPTSEGPILALLRALALRGDRAAALERAGAYDALVRERLDAPPSATVQALMDRIRNERTRPGPPRKPDTVPAPDQRRFPLVGREEELGGILEVWNRVRGGPRPALVLLEGDGGVGKTRLAEEIGARARLDGAVVCAARAVAADGGEPWSGMLALARGALLEAPGLPGAPPRALAALAAELPSWGERFPEARGTEQLSPGRAVLEIVEAIAAEQPILLVVDDAQHLDRQSLLGLLALERDLPRSPVLVLLTTGPRAPHPELEDVRVQLGRGIQGRTIRLEPLEAGALHALVHWALPEYDPTQVERLARRLAVDSAGLPLLVVELLHAVVLGVEPGGEAGAWPEPFRTLDQSLPGDLPDTIVAAIRAGFTRLTPEAQRVLAAASVLPERIPARDLAGVMQRPEPEVVAALDELEWSRWLVSEPRGYAFVARITRDVVAREMLTPGQRQRLLERVAAGG